MDIGTNIYAGLINDTGSFRFSNTLPFTFELARRLGLDEEFPWENVDEAIDYQLAPAGITVARLRSAVGTIFFT